MSWITDNAPGTVGTGQTGLPRDAGAVNQNPIFAPGTNLVPGQDLPLGGITPAATTTSQGPPTLNRNDPASVAAYVQYYASQPGANPSLTRDPQYWIGKISSGELGDDPSYIVSKFMLPEGAPAGQGGALGSLGGGGFGGLLTPWDERFTAPTAAQAEAQPGYQFARDQGLQAIDRSAAAKGTLLTGGTLKDLAGYAGGIASQNYNKVFDQGLQSADFNRASLWGNENNSYNKLYNLSALGRPTVP